MNTPMGNLNNQKLDGGLSARRSRFMESRAELINDSDEDHAERVHEKSRRTVNATTPLTATGILLMALGVVIGLTSSDPFFFWGLGLCGVGLMLLTTITRPLERIHTQLTEINDKLGD